MNHDKKELIMDGCITKFSACWLLAFKESVELKNKIMHREETFKTTVPFAAVLN